MTVVDVIVIFVICLSALFGLLRGFVKESISLIKWILATWIAASFAGKLAPMLPIESEAAAQASAFAILFVLVFMVGALIAFVVATFVKKTGLSGADRVFGLLFGVLRGAVIILVFVMVGQKVSLATTQWWRDSIMLERFERAAIQLQQYLPEIKSRADDTGQFVQDVSNKAAQKALENVDPQQLIEQVQQ